MTTTLKPGSYKVEDPAASRYVYEVVDTGYKFESSSELKSIEGKYKLVSRPKTEKA